MNIIELTTTANIATYVKKLGDGGDEGEQTPEPRKRIGYFDIYFPEEDEEENK